MSLLDAITPKVSGYVIGALAALLVLSNLAWCAHASRQLAALALAEGKTQVAQAALAQRTIERDAWKQREGDLAEANLAAQQSIEQLKAALAAAQGENLRLQQAGRKAIEAAQAQAADADRTLKNFIDRYAAQVKNPDCAGALSTLQHACPALEGY